MTTPFQKVFYQLLLYLFIYLIYKYICRCLEQCKEQRKEQEREQQREQVRRRERDRERNLESEREQNRRYRLETNTYPVSDGEYEEYATESVPSPFSIIKGNGDACAICIEPLNANTAKLNSCIHQFHTECIVPWFNANGTCPTCRKEIE